jgi:hypothetical protein
MSLPNTLNALPFFGQMDLLAAISRGGITPPSQNFAAPLLCLILTGCAALCEAIEVTLVCTAACIVVGGVCLTLEQILKMIAELEDKIAAKKAECEGMGPFGPGDHAGWQLWNICRWELHLLLQELGYLEQHLVPHGPWPRGPSTSNPGGSGRNKPQM